MFRKQGEGVWTGFIWLRIGARINSIVFENRDK
jgi:hypothetical protein